MKIKTFFLIVLASAFFFTGCEKDEFFSSQTEDKGALKSAIVKDAKEVPIKLIGNGYVTVTEFLNDFPSKGVSRGIISHLGKCQEDKSIWVTVGVVPDVENPGFLLWTQEGDWCAANGDLLHWTIETRVDMINQKVSGTAVFTGGTGRFVNATGYFELAGHADPDNPMGFTVDSGEGMISNVGSGK